MPSISVPALVGAGVSAAGSIGGALIGGNAASDAAQAQLQAAQMAQQTQLQMYNTTRSDLMPYMNAGNSAISQLSGLFGLNPQGGQGTGVPNSGALTTALQNFPGYQFGQSQGVQALDRSAASRGQLLSGAQLKDAQTFGQQYGLQNAWQPYLSQMSGIGSLGENAAAQVGNNGLATGQGVANSQLLGGAYQASGIVGGANQLTSALSGLGGQISPLLSSFGGIGGPGAGGLGINTGTSGFNYSPDPSQLKWF